MKSHFSHGIITFHPGYLFRTPEGWSMWAGGAPNHVKDGIQPLAGLVETDWLPFPFTMNWVFTRPGPGEIPQGRAVLLHHPGAGPAAGDSSSWCRSRSIRDADLHGQYEAWRDAARRLQHPALQTRPGDDQGGVAALLLQGRDARDDAPAPKDHVNKRRMNALKLGR